MVFGKEYQKVNKAALGVKAKTGHRRELSAMDTWKGLVIKKRHDRNFRMWRGHSNLRMFLRPGILVGRRERARVIEKSNVQRSSMFGEGKPLLEFWFPFFLE